MKFIDEARNWYKLYSVQVMAVLAALAALEGYFNTFSMFVPDKWKPWLVSLFALAAIAGRLIDQTKVVVEGKEKKLDALAVKTAEASEQAADPTVDFSLRAKFVAKRDALKREFDRLYALLQNVRDRT